MKNVLPQLRPGLWFFSLGLCMWLLLGFEAQAQLNTVDEWVRVNQGFAKCAPVNGFAGEAEWFNDDFTVKRLLGKRGEMYAYIEYGNNGVSNQSCGGGLFRHDTTLNRWIKVGQQPPAGLGGLWTNNTDIFLSTSFPDLKFYVLTEDYINFPTGWKPIGGFRADQLPGWECRGTDNVVMGGEILDVVGDTVYVFSEFPCGNGNQFLKMYVGGDQVIDPATDIRREIIGDRPADGTPLTHFRMQGHDSHTSMFITAPVGGLFRYFSRDAYLGNAFQVPDFLYTYDPRTMPAAQFSGTMPVKQQLFPFGGGILYAGDNGTSGYELFKSDGTNGGTQLVKDLSENENRQARYASKRAPKNFAQMGGFAYFAGYRRATGVELWRTDGTDAGTTLVADIFPAGNQGVPNSSEPGPIRVIGSTLFFAATNSSGGRELWKSDGTTGGTSIVADINPGSSGSNPDNLTVLGTTLFFAATGPNGRELYKCEAPYNSVQLVLDIQAGSGNSNPNNLYAANGLVFFAANNGTQGNELWKSDGTSGGTVLVRNIWLGSGANGNSNPKNFFVWNNDLYFAANDSTNGNELWRSTPPYNAGSTSLFVNINTTARAGSNPAFFTLVGDTLLFRAEDASAGIELWKTGGTVATTRRAVDINTGAGHSGPRDLVSMGGSLYFTADDNTKGRELYRLDSPFITAQVVDIRAGAKGSEPWSLSAVGSILYFVADDGVNGCELWKYQSGSASLVRNTIVAGQPFGWRNISDGPDYLNLTGNSNPWLNTDPGFDPYDSDTWKLRNPNRIQINNAGVENLTASFDKKTIFISTQRGGYQWTGAGYSIINGTSEGNLTFFGTNRGVLQRTNSSPHLRWIDGPVISGLGNTSFYPTCVHSWFPLVATANDGRTWYTALYDMKNPADCGWQNSKAAFTGIYRLNIDFAKPGFTTNISLASGGYFGGTGHDEPVGIAFGGVGRDGTPDIFIAGNMGTADPVIKNKKPATDLTFNVSGYTTINTTRAQLWHFNNRTDTLQRIIYLGTQPSDIIWDIEVVDDGKPGIGRRLVVAGTFGVTCLDSMGQLLWHRDNASLPGTTGNRIFVDIDDNGHVAVLRQRNSPFLHQWGIIDENGVDFSGLTGTGRGFCNDIAIRNDTVAITGFRNGCLPSTRPYCGGAGGGPGTPCGGAEVQTAYIYLYKLAPVRTDAPVMYAKLYDYPDGAQGRDVADTRGYHLNFGLDGKLYFIGESAGSESIFRWDGKENATVELNSVVQGVCDGNVDVVNGGLTTVGLTAVGPNADLSNTADSHIAFFGEVDYRIPTAAGYGRVRNGAWLIPRLPSNANKSNTFRIRTGEGYIHAGRDGSVYVVGTSAFKFTGRDVQTVNGQLIGAYRGGDMTLAITNPNFAGLKFWGTFSRPVNPNDPNTGGGKGTGRGMAIRDTLVAYVADLELDQMLTKAPAPSLSNWNPTETNKDGYVIRFFSDIARYARQDTIRRRETPGDTIVDPILLTLQANFKANVTSVCANPPTSGTVVFRDSSKILPVNATYTGYTWTVRWTFGSGATVVSGNAAFNGVINQGLTGYVAPTVRWSTDGLKTIKMRLVGKHATKDSIVLEEEKFNLITVLPGTITLPSINGPTQVCNGGTYTYDLNIASSLAFGITSYTWTVPAGATIRSGQGGRRIVVRFGATAGNVSVVANTPCGTTAPVSKMTTITTPTFEALLVVNATQLTAGEQFIFNDLQSRGYNVTVRDRGTFDTLDAYCKNILVISATADAARIGNTLRALPVPVVVMNHNLLPSFEMTGPNRGVDFDTASLVTQLNIVSGAHPMRGTLGTGNTTVFSSAQALAWGKPSASAINIAQVGANADQVALFGYETGASMVGRTAPARRVAVFTGKRNSQEQLTTEGRYLISRALCWATDNCDNPTIVLHPLTRSSFSPADSIHYRFTLAGTFNAGNQFTVQWSDALGNFGAPTNSTQSPVIAGTNLGVRTVIEDPVANLPGGSRYSVRIVSSNPLVYSNPITNLTLFGEINAPAKILIVTNKQGPNEALDTKDTALVTMVRRLGFPVEYTRPENVNFQRLAGSQLVVISPLAPTLAAPANTAWNFIRNTQIPVLSLGSTRIDSAQNTGFGFTHLGLVRTNPSGASTRNWVYFPGVDTIARGFDGLTPVYRDGTAPPSGYVTGSLSNAQVWPTAKVFARYGYTTNDNIAAFWYERGDQMRGLIAPGRRGWFGVDFSGADRIPFLSNETRLVLDRFMRKLMNRPFAELSRATVSSQGPFCAGGNISIDVRTTTALNSDNQFIVEMSGPNGLFSEPGYPLVLGTFPQNNSATLVVPVPSNVPASQRYRMRIRSTSPDRVIAVEDTTFTLLLDDRLSNSQRSRNAGNLSTSGLRTDEEVSSWNTYSYNPYESANVGYSYLEQNSGNTPANWLRFTPTVPATGTYEVQVVYPGGLSNTRTSASFRVIHAGGTSTVVVDQTVNANRWVRLGSYTFNAGTSGYIELIGDQPYLRVDAFRLVRNPNHPNPAPAAGEKFFPIGNVWTGAISRDWHNPGNWSLCTPTANGLPDTLSEVLIPSRLNNLNNFPVIENGDAEARTLVVESGDAKLVLRNGRQLRVTQSLTVRDTLLLSGQPSIIGSGTGLSTIVNEGVIRAQSAYTLRAYVDNRAQFITDPYAIGIASISEVNNGLSGVFRVAPSRRIEIPRFTNQNSLVVDSVVTWVGNITQTTSNALFRLNQKTHLIGNYTQVLGTSDFRFNRAYDTIRVSGTVEIQGGSSGQSRNANHFYHTLRITNRLINSGSWTASQGDNDPYSRQYYDADIVNNGTWNAVGNQAVHIWCKSFTNNGLLVTSNNNAGTYFYGGTFTNTGTITAPTGSNNTRFEFETLINSGLITVPRILWTGRKIINTATGVINNQYSTSNAGSFVIHEIDNAGIIRLGEYTSAASGNSSGATFSFHTVINRQGAVLEIGRNSSSFTHNTTVNFTGDFINEGTLVMPGTLSATSRLGKRQQVRGLGTRQSALTVNNSFDPNNNPVADNLENNRAMALHGQWNQVNDANAVGSNRFITSLSNIALWLGIRPFTSRIFKRLETTMYTLWPHLFRPVVTIRVFGSSTMGE